MAKTLWEKIKENALSYSGTVLFTGLSFLSSCTSEDPEQIIPPSQPILENKLVLNEAENVNLGNTFITTPAGYTPIPEEILKFSAYDPKSRTLFFETQNKSITYTITHDNTGKANLNIRGIPRPIQINPNNTLRIDLNADQARIANKTVLEDILVHDLQHELQNLDFFMVNSNEQFNLYQFTGTADITPTTKEVYFFNITEGVNKTITITQDKLGEYINNGAELNGQIRRIEAKPSGNIKISGQYGEELERIINSNPITNEGARIKQGEKFIVADEPAGSPTAQIFEFTSIVPGNYAVFNKITNGTPQTIQVNFTAGQGYLVNSGSSYLVQENSDMTVSIDLDASGNISENKETLAGKLTREENREITQGQDYFVVEESGKPTPYSISNIDTTNHTVDFLNHSTSTTTTEAYDSATKKGIFLSKYAFEANDLGYVKMDLNGDGKIE
ncbi:hypothetical protein GF358_01560 [Candidatus Woesearchaeota archaeon]|nr:hypothetical protein [Candidatus Woesearchaeota archaeon]